MTQTEDKEPGERRLRTAGTASSTKEEETGMTRQEQNADPQYEVIRPGAGQPADEPRSAGYGGQRIIIAKHPGPQEEYFREVWRQGGENHHHRGSSETLATAKDAAGAVIQALCGCPCPD